MTNQSKQATEANQLNRDDDVSSDVSKKGNRTVGIFIILLAIVLLMLGMVGMYTRSEKTQQTESAADETYTVQNDDKGLSSSPPVQMEGGRMAKAAQAQPAPPVTADQIALLQAQQKVLQERLASPLMVVNNNGGRQADAGIQPAVSVNTDPNMQFMAQVSSQTPDVSNATLMGSLNTIVAEGSLIHASLESAINSDLPGFIRASVSEPVYAEDGSTVLIPRGSRLIGEYKSGLLQGQSRIFVVWTRLMTPLGVTINLGSAGTDSLGVAGIGADQIDRHFWAQFGKASLLSMIGAGAANTGGKDDAAGAYREALAGSFSQTANQSLQQEGMIAPTLTVNQGKPVIVFVAKDLNFSSVMQSAQSSIKVF